MLVPLLGSQRALTLLALGNVLVGALLYGAARGGRRWWTGGAAAVLVNAGLAAAASRDAYAAFARFGGTVLWYEEWLEQTVAILQEDGGLPGGHCMLLNGWHQAND